MNWLVIHDLRSFSQHPDMIGCKPKKDDHKEPYYRKFNDVSIGDNVVYYARGNSVIIGIFEVTSDLLVLDDPIWGKVVAYKIQPRYTPPDGTFLNFKKLFQRKNVHFDFLPKVKKWGVYLLGKTCLQITCRDKNIIQDSLNDPILLEYIEDLPIKTSRWKKTY